MAFKKSIKKAKRHGRHSNHLVINKVLIRTFTSEDLGRYMCMCSIYMYSILLFTLRLFKVKSTSHKSREVQYWFLFKDQRY